MSKVLVTGGAGYKGCVLVPKLLEAGHEVVVYDLMLFGAEGLPKDPKLTVIKADIRDIPAYTAALKGVQSVIHMACISNDPSFELDEGLSRTINFDCFEPMVIASKKAGVRRFIYISSSSVYGVSEAPEVTEDHPLVPLTLYNKYKGLCEPLLFKHQSPDFVCVTLRPATVCGYSPRMRFDLTINILTNHAVNRRLITVFGGTQKRPNIHVDDVTELYIKMLEYPDKLVAGETFNAGYENFTVAQLAEFVKNGRRAGVPGEGAHPDHDHPFQRQPLLPRLLPQDLREARLEAEAHDRGRRPWPVPGVQGRPLQGHDDRRELREREGREEARP